MRLSVVIPTLNEVEALPATLEALAHRAERPPEVIVADCGSRDGTPELARRLGAKLFADFRLVEVAVPDGRRGRGAPLDAGAAVATGDVLLFLDADTLPPVGYDRAIATALEPRRDRGAVRRPAVGGAFEFALGGPGWRLRLVELVNRIRYRISRFYYGDQGLFVRAEAFRRAGGFPTLALFESAELCRALKRQGRLVLVRRPIVTSARRFVDGGVLTVFLHDIWLWAFHFLRLPLGRRGARYWVENEEREGSSRSSRPSRPSRRA